MLHLHSYTGRSMPASRPGHAAGVVVGWSAMMLISRAIDPAIYTVIDLPWGMVIRALSDCGVPVNHSPATCAPTGTATDRVQEPLRVENLNTAGANNPDDAVLSCQPPADDVAISGAPHATCTFTDACEGRTHKGECVINRQRRATRRRSPARQRLRCWRPTQRQWLTPIDPSR